MTIRDRVKELRRVHVQHQDRDLLVRQRVAPKVDTGSEALQKMLAELAEQNGLVPLDNEGEQKQTTLAERFLVPPFLFWMRDRDIGRIENARG